MPELGEVKNSIEIGYKSRELKYIWAACIDCGKERWVPFVIKKKIPRVLRCISCAKLRGGKNGRVKIPTGYVNIRVRPDNPLFAMARKTEYGGYIPEHRLIVAQRLNRCLLRSESVHHINGIKDDNRPENLQLLNPNDHKVRNRLCSQCELRKEIRLLRWEIRELKTTLQMKLEVTAK